MFALPPVALSTHDRLTAATFLSEVVATFGLLTVSFGVVRSGRRAAVPIAVAGYIGAAYWFASSTSFANPVGRPGPHPDEHVRRHRPLLRPRLHRRPAHRRRPGRRGHPVLFPEPEPEPSLQETLDTGP